MASATHHKTSIEALTIDMTAERYKLSYATARRRLKAAEADGVVHKHGRCFFARRDEFEAWLLGRWVPSVGSEP